MIKILVDTLGGDKSPAANVEGALCAVREIDDLSVVLVGNTKDNLALLSGDYDRSRVEFIDGLGVISAFIRFGDFDITGYVFRRGVKKDVKSFREYKKDKEDERKETFNYPLFFRACFSSRVRACRFFMPVKIFFGTNSYYIVYSVTGAERAFRRRKKRAGA